MAQATSADVSMETFSPGLASAEVKGTREVATVSQSFLQHCSANIEKGEASTLDQGQAATLTGPNEHVRPSNITMLMATCPAQQAAVQEGAIWMSNSTCLSSVGRHCHHP